MIFTRWAVDLQQRISIKIESGTRIIWVIQVLTALSRIATIPNTFRGPTSLKGSWRYPFCGRSCCGGGGCCCCCFWRRWGSRYCSLITTTTESPLRAVHIHNVWDKDMKATTIGLMDSHVKKTWCFQWLINNAQKLSLAFSSSLIIIFITTF